jgi:hypothetical protein
LKLELEAGLLEQEALGIELNRQMIVNFRILAGPVRFELTMGFPTPVFKTGAFNRSATDPRCYLQQIPRPVR